MDWTEKMVLRRLTLTLTGDQGESTLMRMAGFCPCLLIAVTSAGEILGEERKRDQSVPGVLVEAITEK